MAQQCTAAGRAGQIDTQKGIIAMVLSSKPRTVTHVYYLPQATAQVQARQPRPRPRPRPLRFRVCTENAGPMEVAGTTVLASAIGAEHTMAQQCTAAGRAGQIDTQKGIIAMVLSSKPRTVTHVYYLPQATAQVQRRQRRRARPTLSRFPQVIAAWANRPKVGQTWEQA